MAERPTLETERLILRPFTPEDADDVQRLAGDEAIASTTLNIPHPYEDGVAEEWISTHQEEFDAGKSVSFAITRRDDGTLIGGIGMGITEQHDRAEMGYWIGKPYWNNGYATEAARAVLAYAFEQSGLHRVFATYFTRNPASGRVMEKLGMTHEGMLREHVEKWGTYEDLIVYGILAHEYEQQSEE